MCTDPSSLVTTVTGRASARAGITATAIVLFCLLIIGCRIAFGEAHMGHFHSCSNNSAEHSQKTGMGLVHAVDF